MQKFICETTVQFDELLQRVEAMASEELQLYLLFTGTKDSAGRSWCPDCTAAEPLINEHFKMLPCLFIECPIIRAEFKTADYKYRTDPRIQLRCVPTLIKWRRGKVVASLDDNQCQVAGNISDLIDA